MKLLKRNMTKFEYIAPDGMETDLNDDGEHTGFFRPVYADPVKMKGNISIPSGYVNQTFFGQNIRYTHTLIMDKPDAEIEETGKLLWKGETYDILAIMRSLNSLTAALRQQTRNRAAQEEMPEEPEEPDEPDEPGTGGEGT